MAVEIGRTGRVVLDRIYRMGRIGGGGVLTQRHRERGRMGRRRSF